MSATPTTAQLRARAREAESALDWERAADLYERALAAYPKRVGMGALEERDRASLAQRARNMRAAVQREALA